MNSDKSYPNHSDHSEESEGMKNALRNESEDPLSDADDISEFETPTSQKKSSTKKTTFAESPSADRFDTTFNIDENPYEGKHIQLKKPESKTKRYLKNILAIVICIGLPALWYFDGQIPTQFQFSFGDSEPNTEVVTGSNSGQQGMENFEVSIPDLDNIDIPIPDIEEAIAPEPLSMPYEDYLAQMDQAGYMDQFANHELRAFYQSGVNVEYLQSLENAGLLDEFAFHEIAAFKASGITTDYLTQMQNYGFLDEFAFHEIIAFHEDGISLEYLKSYQDSGYLDEFAFHEIIAFHDSGITTSYLDAFQNAGFLDDYAFHEIVAFYEDGVDAAYLQQLEDRGIREDLAFWEIVDMHE